MIANPAIVDQTYRIDRALKNVNGVDLKNDEANALRCESKGQILTRYLLWNIPIDRSVKVVVRPKNNVGGLNDRLMEVQMQINKVIISILVMIVMIAGAKASDSRFTDITAARLSAAMFERADADRNGWLDIDEYASLALISSELLRLNGGVEVAAFRQGVIPISVSSKALDRAQRNQLVQRSRIEFIMIAGEGFLLSGAELHNRTLSLFHQADTTKDKELHQSELENFLRAVFWTGEAEILMMPDLVMSSYTPR